MRVRKPPENHNSSAWVNKTSFPGNTHHKSASYSKQASYGLSRGHYGAAQRRSFGNVISSIISFGVTMAKRLFLGASRRSATQRRSMEETIGKIVSFVADIAKSVILKTLSSFRRSGGRTQAQRRSMENLLSDIVAFIKMITKRMLLLDDDMAKNGPKAARRQGAAEEAMDPMDQDKQDGQERIDYDSIFFDDKIDDQAYPESDLVGDIRRMG
jgi:hypothetical protein